jgi:hypothetical protein
MSNASARGWGRHLEGWPIGLWIVGVAAISAALLVPRPVPPDFVPPPVIDRVEQRELRDVEVERARRARAGLPLEVRSVGEAFRRYGHAAYGSPALLPQIEAQLRRLAGEAIARDGAERFLELRALELQLFQQALREGGSEPTPAAIELGGGLLRLGFARGWFEPAPAGADPGEVGALFRIYWAEVLGLMRQHPFMPTLNEWRAYYRFLLARPTSGGPDRDGDLGRKLEYVAALAQHDQEYPADLARGIFLYQRGAPAAAASALRRHLERFPDGPWALRAKNYLAACGALLID